MTKRQKTPIFHRFRPDQYDQTLSKSPNLYTKEFQQDKRFKESTSRESLGRNKYKKGQQTRISNKFDDETEKITTLMKENSDLRKQIVELKVQQFYQFDDKKLKDLLIENQTLKKQLKKCKQSLQETKLQNDFLRRKNTEIQRQIQKLQGSQFCNKKNKENTLQTVALSPRNTREDQQLTQKIIQKPVISSSSNNDYDDFDNCRKLLESKSTSKRDRTKKLKESEDDYFLLLESKNHILQPLSPRNSSKPTMLLSPRASNDTLQYKNRKNLNLKRSQN